jgi:hypothetical protein
MNAAFSASSRLFDLNGEANRVRKNQSSAIIAVDVRRFGHVINKDEVFGTHTLLSVPTKEARGREDLIYGRGTVYIVVNEQPEETMLFWRAT